MNSIYYQCRWTHYAVHIYLALTLQEFISLVDLDKSEQSVNATTKLFTSLERNKTNSTEKGTVNMAKIIESRYSNIDFTELDSATKYISKIIKTVKVI